jgi:hypothetical protein
MMLLFERVGRGLQLTAANCCWGMLQGYGRCGGSRCDDGEARAAIYQRAGPHHVNGLFFTVNIRAADDRRVRKRACVKVDVIATGDGISDLMRREANVAIVCNLNSPIWWPDW